MRGDSSGVIFLSMSMSRTNSLRAVTGQRSALSSQPQEKIHPSNNRLHNLWNRHIDDCSTVCRCTRQPHQLDDLFQNLRHWLLDDLFDDTLRDALRGKGPGQPPQFFHDPWQGGVDALLHGALLNLLLMQRNGSTRSPSSFQSNSHVHRFS